MNRFRTKKKAKENKDSGEPIGLRSNDLDAPSAASLKPSMTFRRGKKPTQDREEKIELDLANALPAADDFRTSLLMTGLSARFSMLREQDDPTSKLGKASDDSVLSPKRLSRLGNFGFQPNALADIAEVASIKDSIRRPFALERTESSNSIDYGTDDDSNHGGSIMARHKHGEGNNLFGGRQKIYKIPLSASSSSKNLAEEAAGMGGRALYVRDVSQSTFQTLRDAEKEARDLETEHLHDDSDMLSLPRRSESPSLPNYNRNRETSSTSSSGPSLTRSSTAATSVTSQRSPSANGHSSPSTTAVTNQSGLAPERTATKSKRLYETGLDQHLHSQQYSSINRLDGLSRQRALGARPPSPIMSSPNSAQQDMPNLNTALPQSNSQLGSPNQSSNGAGNFDFGLKPPSLQAPKLSYGVSPPLSPPMSEADDQTILPIQPNDKGKATALGTFSKPATPYDEIKYTQRQLQMQQGRETPPLRKHSPPRPFNVTQRPFARSPVEPRDGFPSTRSPSRSSPIQGRLPQSKAPMNPMWKDPTLSNNNFSNPSGTFLDSPNSSAKISDLEPGEPWGQPTISINNVSKISAERLAGERPPESAHPAYRKIPPRLQVEDSSKGEPDYSQEASHDNDSADADKLQKEDNALPADSPTLGPATNGLSGLVRQHLRSDSNASSIYGAPSPGVNSRFYPHDPMPEMKYSTHGNPWASSNFESDEKSDTGKNGIPDMPVGNDLLRNEWPSPQNAEETEHASWEKELASHHARSGSSETQKERREFAHELAARRRRVQENLRSFVEADSRSASPAPGFESNKENSLKNTPLGILKTKSSRGSLVIKTKEGSSKAMKMLGIGNTTISSSPSPNSQRPNEHLWKEEEEEMLRGMPVKPPRSTDQTRAFRQARREAQRDRERQVLARRQYRDQADAEDESEDAAPNVARSPVRHRGGSPEKYPATVHPRQRTPSEERSVASSHEARAPSRESKRSVATSNKSGGSRPSRDRSGSEASERSKSRNGRYRDDLAKAMADGIGSSAHGTFEDSSAARAQGRSPGLAVPHQSTANAESPTLGNSELHPGEEQFAAPPAVLDIGLSPRPSPVTPFSINSTPALGQPSPNGSSTSTPTGPGFQSQGRIPPSLKRPVNKADISDPVFVSTTSQVTTINLTVAAAQQTSMPLSAPPLPPIDPRRRQTRTQTMLAVLKGKGTESAPITPPLPSNGNDEEKSVFSADEAEEKPKPRQKLRKSSSDGANLNIRAQKAFNATPSPALPSQTFLNGPSTPLTAVQATFPAGASQPHTPVEGGMF